MSFQEALLFGTVKLSCKLSRKNRFSSFFKSLTEVSIMAYCHFVEAKTSSNPIFPNGANWVVSRNSPVIRQKGESQKGCFKKTKHAKFSEKKNIFLPPDAHTHVNVYFTNRNMQYKGWEPHGIELKDLMKKMGSLVLFTHRVRIIKMSEIAHTLYFLLMTARKTVTIWAKYSMH